MKNNSEYICNLCSAANLSPNKKRDGQGQKIEKEKNIAELIEDNDLDIGKELLINAILS